MSFKGRRIAIPKCSIWATYNSFWGTQIPTTFLLVCFHDGELPTALPGTKAEWKHCCSFLMPMPYKLPAAALPANTTPGLSRFPSIFACGDSLSVTRKHDLCSKESISADIDQHLSVVYTHTMCCVHALRPGTIAESNYYIFKWNGNKKFPYFVSRFQSAASNHSTLF